MKSSFFGSFSSAHSLWLILSGWIQKARNDSPARTASVNLFVGNSLSAYEDNNGADLEDRKDIECCVRAPRSAFDDRLLFFGCFELSNYLLNGIYEEFSLSSFLSQQSEAHSLSGDQQEIRRSRLEGAQKGKSERKKIKLKRARSSRLIMSTCTAGYSFKTFALFLFICGRKNNENRFLIQ